MQDSNSSLLALDVGGRRIGVAVANVMARIAHPLVTIEHTADTAKTVQRLAAEQQAVGIVIGLPRNLSGEETEQTRTVRSFAAALEAHVSVPLYWQDEAVTSRQAEAELIRRGKPYVKGDIDALAATYILEDYLQEHPGGSR